MVVVSGEALIDIVPASDGGRRGTAGGGPFNAARALARLDVPTQFLGRLSTDAFGDQLQDLLAADGADLSLTSVGPEPTTLASASIDHDGHAAYRFVFEGTSAPNLTPEILPSSLDPAVTALHVGTLGLLLEPMATTIAGLVAREHKKRLVMTDPNIRPSALSLLSPSPLAGEGRGGGYRARLDRVIAQSTIVKASDADVAWLYPALDLQSAARAMLARGPRLVVVTLGPDGAFAVSADAEARVAARVVDVVDTIGAGDAFGAALLAWLHDHDRLSLELRLTGDELGAALGFACLVASLTCTRAGADPPRRAELGLAIPEPS